MTFAAPIFPQSAGAGWRHHLVLWIVIACCLWMGWTGHIASDDMYYANAGAGWAFNFPYVAPDFPTARAVIALPIGIVIALLGESEFTIGLSTCLFFAATASLTLAAVSRLTGAFVATLACCLMCTIPMFALKPTIVSADQPELFFVTASIGLFWLATLRERRFWLLVGSGACTALAFGAHEVTGGLIIGYLVLFLAGYRIPRLQYWTMAIGFLAVVALECLYYAIVAGDPMYRISMLIPIMKGGAGLGPLTGDRVDGGMLQLSLGGTIHVSKAIDPVVMFFTHHDFGLLSYFAVPALWWSCVKERRNMTLPLVTARLLGIFALVWFLFAAVLLRDLVLGSRYYMATAYLLAVITVLWVCIEVWPHHRRWLFIGAAVFVFVNCVSIFLDDKNPRFGERMLTQYLSESKGDVQVDPETAHRSVLYCRWSGQDCTRIKAVPPREGGAEFYFYYANNALPGYNKAVKTQEDISRYRPDPSWEVVWGRSEPDKPLSGLFKALNLESKIPAAIYRKLAGPGRSVVVYRIPGRSGGPAAAPGAAQ